MDIGHKIRTTQTLEQNSTHEQYSANFAQQSRSTFASARTHKSSDFVGQLVIDEHGQTITAA